jgi:hypothetical protein
MWVFFIMQWKITSFNTTHFPINTNAPQNTVSYISSSTSVVRGGTHHASFHLSGLKVVAHYAIGLVIFAGDNAGNAFIGG